MTENKRFKSSTYQDALSGVYDRKENLTVNECCNLLNQLNDENEQLKEEIKAKDKIIELYYEMVKE